MGRQVGHIQLDKQSAKAYIPRPPDESPSSWVFDANKLVG